MRSILGLTLALSLGLAACGDKEDGDSGSDGTTDGTSDGTDGASDGTDGASDGASDGTDGTDGGGGADGAAVYAGTCANCHGASGTDGPADLTIRIPAMSDAEIETLVRNGRGYMPAHDFTADEMSGLLSYLRDTFN